MSPASRAEPLIVIDGAETPDTPATKAVASSAVKPVAFFTLTVKPPAVALEPTFPELRSRKLSEMMTSTWPLLTMLPWTVRSPESDRSVPESAPVRVPPESGRASCARARADEASEAALFAVETAAAASEAAVFAVVTAPSAVLIAEAASLAAVDAEAEAALASLAALLALDAAAKAEEAALEASVAAFEAEVDALEADEAAALASP
jgi:hypothetical protein